jgi:ketosteroid isomerase-like protein
MRKALGVVVLLFAVGCRPPIDVARETEALLQADRAWAQAAASGGSPDSVLGFWTEDARVAMAGAPLVRGKAGIRQMVTSMLAIPGFHISWTPEQAVVAASGDLGYTVGTNTVTIPDSTGKVSAMTGRYLTVWRKEADGRWRCAEDYASPGPVEPPK